MMKLFKNCIAICLGLFLTVLARPAYAEEITADNISDYVGTWYLQLYNDYVINWSPQEMDYYLTISIKPYKEDHGLMFYRVLQTGENHLEVIPYTISDGAIHFTLEDNHSYFLQPWKNGMLSLANGKSDTMHGLGNYMFSHTKQEEGIEQPDPNHIPDWFEGDWQVEYYKNLINDVFSSCKCTLSFSPNYLLRNHYATFTFEDGSVLKTHYYIRMDQIFIGDSTETAKPVHEGTGDVEGYFGVQLEDSIYYFKR